MNPNPQAPPKYYVAISITLTCCYQHPVSLFYVPHKLDQMYKECHNV